MDFSEDGSKFFKPLLKRFFDIFFSIAGLVIFLPLLVLISLIIKLEDGGPVLFCQERIGRFGKKFIILKFRSMSSVKSPASVGFEPGNKSRITKTGSIIRKTKLDELPQLLNVLKGEMSFVGPRPEVEYWVNKYPERWKQLHQLRPGITDNASIEFRNEEDVLEKASDPAREYEKNILPKKLGLYEQYINNRSLVGDFRIIIQTILTLFKN